MAGFLSAGESRLVNLLFAFDSNATNEAWPGMGYPSEAELNSEGDLLRAKLNGDSEAAQDWDAHRAN